MSDTSPTAQKKGFAISVFARCLIILAVTTGIVAASIGVLSDRTSRGIAEDGMRSLAKDVTKLLADNIGGAVRFAKTEDVLGAIAPEVEAEKNKLLAVIVIGSDGQSLTELGEVTAPDMEQLRQLAATALATGDRASTGDGFWISEPVRFTGGEVVGAIATIWTPNAALANIAADRQRQLLIAVGLFVGLMILAGFYLRHSLFNSLTHLTNRTRELADGDLEGAIDGLGRRDEIGATAGALDELRRKLKAAEASNHDAMVQGAAFQASPDGMVILDPDLQITHANKTFRALTTSAREAVLHIVPGSGGGDLIGQSLDSVALGVGSSGDLQKRSDFPVRTGFQLGERLFSASVNVVRDADDQVAGYVVEMSDATDRQKATALLSSLEAEQLRADFNANGELISCNDVFRRSFAIDEAARLSSTINQLLSADDGTDIAQRLAGKRTFIGRVTAQIDGTSRLLDGSLNPVEGPDGATAAAILIARDVTQAEAALRAAESEKERHNRNRQEVMDTLRDAMKSLSEGNLQVRIDTDLPDEYEPLRRDFNASVEALETAVGLVDENAASILGEAGNISRAADNLSQRTEQQASTLEQFAAALAQMTASVQSAAERADSARTIVIKARDGAESSGEVVQQAVEAMGAIAASSDQISRIIGVIDEIAFQTNLLALNAGVEAARAGDAGRGFAVVASEVRALAQRSSEAASEINDLISSSSTQVDRGVKLVGNAGDALKSIVASVNEMTEHVSEIAASAREQASGLEEINGAMGQLDQVTQQNAAMFEETTAATHTLNDEANALAETTRRFQTSRHAKSASQKPRQASPARPQEQSGITDNPKAGFSKSDGNLALAPVASDDWEDF